MVCGSVPHSQVTSSVSGYPHFLRVTLQRPVPHLNLLRHFHSARLESAPGGSSSLALMYIVVVDERLAILSSHKATLVLSAPLGSTSLRKLFLDLSRLFAGSWPNRGCRSSVVWRWRSLLLAALRRISGGAIPDRMYRLSIGVGLRHPVIRRQVALMAGSIFLACADLSQTGQAYSAVE